MVDNVITNPGAGGAIFASDDIGGVHYPRIKNTFGDDGAAIDVSATNPMPVGLPSAQIAALAPLATQPVSFSWVGLTDAQLRASAVPVLLASTIISNFPATQAVTGTFFQATQPISAASLPLPTGAATEATLSALNAKEPALGPALPAASSPVTLSNDLTVGAAASIAALNVDLLTGVASGWYDAANFHSCSIQIIGGSAITAGAIIFEQTNDITNAAAGNVWPVEETTSLTPTPNITAIAIAASTTRMFAGSVKARFVRVRVSTAFVTGTVQAVGVFSQLAYSRDIQTVHQGALGSLLSQVYFASNSLTTDIASAALTLTTTTAAISQTIGLSYEVNIPVTAVSGTTPTLDFSIEESDDTGVNWFKVYDFPRITAVGAYRSPKLPYRGNRIRYVQTVGGTTPSFTRAVNRISTMDSTTAIAQLIDRALATAQALNAVTASVGSQNCRTAQLVINGAAITTAPAIQLEGSEDNGATWYAIGTPLTAVANSTVQVTIANINVSLLRGRVSTTGVTATLGYVLIKAF
jgi:hypothetical protein